MRIKKIVRKFRSHEEQEEAEIKYYRRLSPDKKILELEFIRNRYIYYKYGRIPRLKRVLRIVKRK